MRPAAAPGQAFTYSLVASCSGLEESYINASLVDVIPPEVEVTSLPQSIAGQQIVTCDEGTRTLTIAFVSTLLPPNPLAPPMPRW